MMYLIKHKFVDSKVYYTLYISGKLYSVFEKYL